MLGRTDELEWDNLPAVGQPERAGEAGQFDHVGEVGWPRQSSEAGCAGKTD